MEKTRRPQTQQECFEQLDKVLSEEEKKIILNTDDLFRLHFSLGMWIRNNWIYDTETKSDDDFISKMMNKILMDPDSVSSEIIRMYQDYLKKKSARQ